MEPVGSCRRCLRNIVSVFPLISIVPARSFRWYRRPKKIHHEIRPDPPPYFGKGDLMNKKFEALQSADEKVHKSLIEGLDYPMMTSEARARLISCSDQVFDPYKPSSNQSTLVESVKTPARSFAVRDRLALRQMRKSMGDFDKANFLELSHKVYLDLFREMSRIPIKVEKVMEFCTEHCYPILMNGLSGTQIQWKYLETVEPSRIVKARVGSFVQDDHEFGQITVRKHSKQILAIYDRFGRLMKGHPIEPRSVLEFIVFERHMRPHDWGSEWRVHAKIEAPQSAPGHDTLKDGDYSLSSHNLKADFKTHIVSDSFVPQFSTVPPSPPVDPRRWNKKWEDPGYYQLTDEEEEEIKKQKLRRRRLFDMHPTVRI